MTGVHPVPQPQPDSQQIQGPSFLLKGSDVPPPPVETQDQQQTQLTQNKEKEATTTIEIMPRDHSDIRYNSLDEETSFSPKQVHHTTEEHNANQNENLAVDDFTFAARTPLTLKQILYLGIMQGFGSFAVNFGINFLIAWLMYREIGRIPLAGSLTCIISDVAVTSFAVAFLTSLLGTLLVRNDLRQGKIVTPLDNRWLLHPIFKYVPKGVEWKPLFLRSLEIGFFATVVYTIPTELIMIGAARNGMQIEWAFCIFKGVWGGIEGGLIGPYAAMLALAA